MKDELTLIRERWAGLDWQNKRQAGQYFDFTLYRTLLLQVYLPFTAQLQILRQEGPRKPPKKIVLYDETDPFYCFQRDWHIRPTSLTRGWAVSAEVLSAVTRVERFPNRKVQEALLANGFALALIDLRAGRDQLRAGVARIERIYRARPNLVLPKNPADVLRLPSDRLEPDFNDLEYIRRYSAWERNSTILREVKATTGLLPTQSSARAVGKRNDDIVEFIDPKDISIAWRSARKTATKGRRSPAVILALRENANEAMRIRYRNELKRFSPN